MADAQTLAANIEEALDTAFRGSLLARGQARSMIWRKGVLPDDAPEFSPNLSYDLLSYGFALITQGLQLLDLGEKSEAARMAFENAASAIESATMNAAVSPETDFHRLIAGAAFHLGGYSARAFSVLHRGIAEANLSPVEVCLARLILRDLDGLAEDIASMRGSGKGNDDALLERIKDAYPEDDGEADDGDWDPAYGGVEYGDSTDHLTNAVDLALTDNFMGGLSAAMLAFARGERPLLEQAIVTLERGLSASGDAGMIAQWWCHRLTIHLLDDLWDKSFHERLPAAPDGPGDWHDLRALFIASLYRRSRAEIELWPSQLEAAKRAVDFGDNMVVNRRPKRTPYRRPKGTPFVERCDGYGGRAVRAGCGVGRA